MKYMMMIVMLVVTLTNVLQHWIPNGIWWLTDDISNIKIEAIKSEMNQKFHHSMKAIMYI